MLRSIMMASVLVLSMAACGGDDSGDDNGDNGDDPADDVEVLAAGDCGTPAATVTTTGMAFTGGNATIDVGDTVLFMPAGGHDMASDNGKFDTGALGAAACLKFNTAGSYPYKCSAHPSMTGTITVE